MNRLSTFVLLVGFLLNIPSFVLSQGNIRFENYGVDDGLFSNTVSCIHQDNVGWIWIGTNRGICRFDGHNFHPYTPKNDLSTEHYSLINCIFEDSKSRLWIGTEDDGMALYDRSRDEFNYFNADSGKNTISSNLVYSIAEDSTGILWIGTEDGLNRFDPETQSFEWIFHHSNLASSIAHNNVEKVFIDSKGRIWLGTKNGLDYYDPASRKASHIPLDAKNRLEQNVPYYIQDIDESKDGKILVGTYSSGLFIIDQEKNRISNILPDADYNRSYTIRGIYEDKNNNIWLGTRGGLYILDSLLNVHAHYIYDEHNENSLSHISVNNIYEDHTGNIWIGTRNGMNFVNQSKQAFSYYGFKPNDNRYLNNAEVYAITEAKDGKIWLGTENGGINIYNKENETFSYLTHDEEISNSIASNCIKSIIQDKKGNFWIGTFWGGLDHYNPSNKRFTHYKNIATDNNSISNNTVWALLEDRKGRIWIGTDSGLDIYDPTLNSFQHYIDNVNISPIHVLYEDRKGNIYIGTTKHGMYVFTSENQVLNYDVLARTILEDSNGRIWIGSGTYNGLIQFEAQKGVINTFTTNHGLPSNQILGILEGENAADIWISTGSGLSRFNPDSLHFENFTKDDGVQSNTFYYGAYCKSKTGELYFGGQKGLSSFYPDRLLKNNHIPPVIISDFKIFNKKVPINQEFQGKLVLEKSISETNEITIDYKNTVLTFDFIALNYVISSQNLYTYILDGFEEEWNPVTDNRSATYTNLDPGKYTLRVKASNNDNVWNEEGTSLDIIVTPPLWKTAVFKILMILSLAFLVYWVISFFVKRENLKNQLVMERMKSKELHKIDLMKFQFFTNISHEIRTPISLILSPLSRIINSNPSKEQIKKDLDVVYKNATRLGKLVDQLLDFRKIEAGKLKLELSKGDIVSYLKKIIYLFQELSNEKNINLDFISVQDQVQMYFDPDKVEKVIFNLLSNSFKASKAGDSIKVAVSLTIHMDSDVSDSMDIKPGEYLQIVVQDTGKGIPENIRKRIFDRFYQGKNSSGDMNTGSGIGLSLSRELIKIHNGSISLKSQEGIGTEITILLPLIKVDPQKPYKIKELNLELQESEAAIDTESFGEDSFDHNKPIILIIEDNKELLEFIISIFEEEYNVISAEDGEEGLRLANETIPDIVISDILMPKLDGKKFCKTLKQDFKTSHIPIILLTALSSKEHEKEGILAGADDYMTKPFDPSLINLRVNQLLSTRRILKEKFSQENILKPLDKNALSPDDKFINKLIAIIEDNISDPNFGITKISREIGVSRTQLYRKMNALTEMTVKEFIRSIRLKHACQLLIQKEMNISEVAYSVGFQQIAYFRKCFKSVYKLTPSEYIKKYTVK